jgi:hypothetical protein
MIQHEITIYKWVEIHYLKTLNRDLKIHREGDLPARWAWNPNGTFAREKY